MEHQDPPINKQQLADKANISYPTLVPILQGVRDFGITKLINIAEALNVSPNEILNKTYTESKTTSGKLGDNIEYYGIFISSADSTYFYFYNKITDETSYFVTEFIISCSLNYIDIVDNIKSTRKRRYLGRYFAHPMMQNRRAKRDDYKPSAVRVTQR
ncbi:helix-turn-helix domain-containing protein [Piscirickettsia salmonis]|nr:helix-turn-helix transcriptional regulator [Piscirickettsia salmonis]APS64827.1 hypothetical protein AVI54_14280 [Piscirickettsia salmonis]